MENERNVIENARYHPDKELKTAIKDLVRGNGRSYPPSEEVEVQAASGKASAALEQHFSSGQEKTSLDRIGPKRNGEEPSSSISSSGRFTAVEITSGTLFSADEGNLEEPLGGAKEHNGLTQEDPPSNRASNAVTRVCNFSTFYLRESRRVVQPLVGFSILAMASRKYELRVSRCRFSGTSCKKDATFLTPKIVKIV
ncbi:hypothetical protein LguiB_008602 [Lonicera macranthoides]